MKTNWEEFNNIFPSIIDDIALCENKDDRLKATLRLEKELKDFIAKEKAISKEEGRKEEREMEANAIDDDGNPVRIYLS